jgi:N-acetylmuramoyl-L-alanine amidase
VGFVFLRHTAITTALALSLIGCVDAWAAERAAAAPPPPAAQESLPAATDVRVGGDDRQTRFVVDLTQKLDVTAFALANPYRVVVDLPQIAFKLPDKAGEQPARLVLDLSATDRDSFMRTISLESHPARSPPVKPGEVAAKAAGDPRPLIVLDPGHGGIDNGAKAQSGELEKDVVLQFALALRKKLEASGKYRVAMTRDDDTFIPLSERVRFGRSHGASLFVSIHADAIPRSEGQAEGATVYTLSENASDAEAARLAEAENRADVIAGVDLTAEPDDVANILVDLAQRETKTYSSQFARTLVGELKSTARLHKNPLKAAGFKVLTAPDVPSVLVELGYMTTKDDLKLLTSTAWQDKTARALSQAVDAFFTPRLARGAGAN